MDGMSNHGRKYGAAVVKHEPFLFAFSPRTILSKSRTLPDCFAALWPRRSILFIRCWSATMTGSKIDLDHYHLIMTDKVSAKRTEAFSCVRTHISALQQKKVRSSRCSAYLAPVRYTAHVCFQLNQKRPWSLKDVPVL